MPIVTDVEDFDGFSEKLARLGLRARYQEALAAANSYPIHGVSPVAARSPAPI